MSRAVFPATRTSTALEQEGVGYYQLTVKNGQRCSAAVAYLHPAMDRPNLRVETGALTSRVLFEGKKAVGVEYVQNGETKTARAAAEVILAGGAINSPQLLQLSGVGPGELLREKGVTVVADLAGVGENLQDHYVLANALSAEARHRLGQLELTRGTRFIGEALKYIFQRKGLLTLSAAHIAVFCKSRPELTSPDIQFHILPATPDVQKMAETGVMELEALPGLTIAPCQVRPESRGAIRIKSANPAEYPSIQPNYLSDPIDQQVAVASLRWGRRIAGQPALAKWIESELLPGPDMTTDEQLLGFAASSRLDHLPPPGRHLPDGGTAHQAVVDTQLRVHGVEGLHVWSTRLGDAGAWSPRQQRNAPTIMIAAEKAAGASPRQGPGQRAGGVIRRALRRYRYE